MYIQYWTLYPTSIVFCIIPYIALPLSYLPSSHLIFLTSSSLSLFPQPLYQFCHIALILLRYSYSSLHPHFLVPLRHPFFPLNLSSAKISRHDNTKKCIQNISYITSSYYFFNFFFELYKIVKYKFAKSMQETSARKFVKKFLKYPPHNHKNKNFNNIYLKKKKL